MSSLCADMSELSDDDCDDDTIEWVSEDAFPFLNDCRQSQAKGSGPGKRSLKSVVRPRLGQLYDNCIVESIDGDLLCRISRKRCLWYVNRQLADIVKDGPELIIRLKFVAKGGPRDDDLFPLSAKANVCARCGKESNLLRAYIVPHCYRRELPKQLSSHQSHDITLLCVSCYEIWAQAHASLRNQISTELGIPIDGVRVGQAPDQKHVQVVQTARTLLKYRTIPQDRRRQLLRTVADYNGWNDLPSDEVLREFADAAQTDDDRPLIPHGRLVVQALPDLSEFIRRWRRHFVECMQPGHLPAHWEINYGLSAGSQ